MRFIQQLECSLNIEKDNVWHRDGGCGEFAMMGIRLW